MAFPLRAGHGFTLVEALVAATLVATAVVVLAHLAAIGTRQSAQNRRTLTALVAAQGKLEQLRAVVWSYTDGGGGLTPSPPRSLVQDYAGFVDEAGDMVLRWLVAAVEPSDPNTMILQVCAYTSHHADRPPEACVSTIRTRRP